ncbi:helix-turn-helix transcriptional regulator [Variovorax sp. GB1P17]|uniref:helix-turn-helix transcriptional regulator n=1 Tax=Variovorax sp. GB1P17 TaxID=3443740 RepID=UPI003F48DF59
MPIQPQTVPIQPSPFIAALREDDFNAALIRLPTDRPLALPALHDGASREVCWPRDGGRILRLRTSPWEGASALYFDFRLNDDLHVQLPPGDELLLTFFLSGHITGKIGSTQGRPLDFRVDRALLRTPNRDGGYLIHIPGACRNNFVQFRLRRELLPRWLHALGVRLPARRMSELVDRDDGRVLCNAALTPRVRDCLARISDEPTDRPAFVPLFHARAAELLTCVLLDLDQLLRPARSDNGDGSDAAAATVRRLRALLGDAPARAWTVDELARRLDLRAVKLQAHVREAEGTTVYSLLMAERMALAARLLRDTQLSVQAIAAEAGWACHGRFTAAFRQHHSATPREYRLRQAPAANAGA